MQWEIEQELTEYNHYYISVEDQLLFYNMYLL